MTASLPRIQGCDSDDRMPAELNRVDSDPHACLQSFRRGRLLVRRFHGGAKARVVRLTEGDVGSESAGSDHNRLETVRLFNETGIVAAEMKTGLNT